ncbi:MAG: protein TolB [Desulfotalea sp.]
MTTQKIINKISQVIILSTILLFPIFQCMAADRVYLDISAPETRKINVAVPWFIDGNESGISSSYSKSLANTLAKALKFHGIIDIIPTVDYSGSQVADWKALNADYVVFGKYNVMKKNTAFELRLYDVAEDDYLLGKSYRGTKDQINKMLYKFTDASIKELTGIDGIASTKIAFVSYETNTKDIYLTDILGKKIRQVTRHNNLTVSPRFTPDGNHLSYSSYHSGNQNLYLTDLRQNKITRAVSRKKGLNLAPAWAPDGKTCILTISEYGAPDLYKINRDGSIVEQLTNRAGANLSPTYSPDGNHIVFVSDRSGRPQLYLMDLKTKSQKRITYVGPENSEPNWSPTENKIVYSSRVNGVYQLFTIDPFSSDEPVQITKDASRHEAPVWSPDGNQIIFTKRDGRRQQIYAVMKNGDYQRKVFSFPGNQSSPRWAK